MIVQAPAGIVNPEGDSHPAKEYGQAGYELWMQWFVIPGAEWQNGGGYFRLGL